MLSTEINEQEIFFLIWIFVQFYLNLFNFFNKLYKM